ncbi:MAG: twin-arginine translocase subunit TatC [Chthonomonas sp.]|nr:twin-arginine translocase subunit TatC [Chthonomonas sp.]
MLTEWLQKRNSSEHDPDEFRAPLGQHIDELRSRVLRIFAFLIVGWVIGYYIQTPIYDQLMGWARSTIPKGVEYKEAFKNLVDPFMLKMKFGFFVGLILVFPFVAVQLWGFIKPGLKTSEQRPFRIVVPVSLILFAMGSGLCYLILPTALQWFSSYVSDYSGAVLYQEPGTLVFFIVKMMLAFGLAFQLPVVVYFLAKIGLLTVEGLFAYWRQATVGIFFVSMIITPSNDPLSMIVMAIPMTVLYVLTILAVKWTSKDVTRDPVLDALDG